MTHSFRLVSPEPSRHETDELSPIAFTRREQDALRASFAILLSPLDAIDANAWRSDVARTLAGLLGADRAVFQLDLPGTPVLYSEDYRKSTLDDYVNHYHAIDVGRKRRDALGIEAWNRWLLHGRDLRKFWESEIHRDFLVPNKILDSMGLTVKVRGAASPASVFFHSEKLGRPEFGERGVALLSMLLPAFKAGVRDFVRYFNQRDSLTTHLDSLNVGIRICDLDGSTVHQNPAFTAALATEGVSQNMEKASAEILRELVTFMREKSINGPALAGFRVTREVHVPLASFEIRGTFLGRELHGAEQQIAIWVDRMVQATTLSDRVLKERFSLTTRELEVARCLAQGQSTKELAQSCGISLHTARRHTEKVFAKLKVRNRSQVGPKLRGS
jgi:DNA-binding CsgD family transcriptional regulator